MRKRRLFSNAKPASGDCGLQPSLIASRECVRPGIGSCALLVSHWDVTTFNVEVRRRATISPALRDQRPKFELPEPVASLSKDSAPCQPPEFGAGPPIFPWLWVAAILRRACSTTGTRRWPNTIMKARVATRSRRPAMGKNFGKLAKPSHVLPSQENRGPTAIYALAPFSPLWESSEAMWD